MPYILIYWLLTSHPCDAALELIIYKINAIYLGNYINGLKIFFDTEVKKYSFFYSLLGG